MKRHESQTFETEHDLALGVAFLSSREERFALVSRRLGMPPLRRSKGNFQTLVHIIVEQMISLSASKAISARLQQRLIPFAPETVCMTSFAMLRSLGLSEAKARAVKAVANAVRGGELNLEELASFDDEKAKAVLMALPGIGPWTAEIYILTALGRSDAWPAGDVALQVAVQDLFGLECRPDHRQMSAIAESWRPWRAAAARLLWSHYRNQRGLGQKLAL